MSYQATIARISGRQLRGLELELGRVQRAVAGQGPVFATPPQAHGLLAAAPPAVTQGAQLAVPGIPGVTQAMNVTIPGHFVPGAADVLKQAGLPLDKLPTDAEGAIKAGIQAAGQIAAKFVGPAITNLVASVAPGVVSTVSSMAASMGIGQGLGSALPGIGNLVGLAITGLVAAVKALIKLFTGRQQCDFDPKCPDLASQIANLSPVDALPVIARELADTSKRLAKKAIDEDCYLEPKSGKGGKTYECIRYLLAVWGRCYEFAKDTPDVMGLPQLQRLIPIYSQMPTHTYTADFGQRDRVVEHLHFTEQRGKVHDWTTREAQRQNLGTDDVSIQGMIARMQRRHAYLLDLSNKMANLAGQQGGGLHLRFNVVTELRRATEQYVYNQSPEIALWLQTVGQWMQQIANAEQARDQAVLAHAQDIQRRQQAIQQLPPAQRAAVERKGRIDQLKFLCTEANDVGPACDELRQLLGGGAAAPSNQAAALRKLATARNAYLYKYLQSAAQRGNVTARVMFERAKAQPGMTRANLFDKVYAYVEAEAKGGDKAAQIVLFAANTEFGQKLKAAAQAQRGTSSGYSLRAGLTA